MPKILDTFDYLSLMEGPGYLAGYTDMEVNT